MRVYIYPEDSSNFEISDFGVFASEIKYWLDKGVTPFIGGDFNSRMGDLNLFFYAMNWKYAKNVDTYMNKHGAYFSSICDLLKLSPLNHCIYCDKRFEGKFTYYTQIDFAIINSEGRRK